MYPIIRYLLKSSLQICIARDKFIWKLPQEHSGSVCLTFDDGPDPKYTLPILDVLDQYDMKATFFLIGEKVKLYPNVVKAIVERGHYTSAHTFTHTEITNFSNSDLQQELNLTRAILKDVTGRDCITFRPPLGRMNLRTLRASTSYGYKVIHWTKSYSDYLRDGSDKLISRMLDSPVQNRDIVLLHDSNPYTVKSLNHLIKNIKSRGIKNAIIDEQGNIITRAFE